MFGTFGQQLVLPMKRSEDVLTENVDDETVVYDLNTKQVHCLSPLAAAVFTLCDGHTPSSEIAGLAQERLGTAVEEEDVANALAQLADRDLLKTPPLVLREGLSRRDLMLKTAYVGAATAGASLITTVGAASAGTTGSLGNPGDACTQNKQCKSGHCCLPQAQGVECNVGLCVACDNACKKVNGACKGFCDPLATDECRCLV